MLSPETNATAEETNATAEAQMPGGRVKSWTTKDNKFLLGAAAATAGGVGSVAALAVAAATIPPDPPPNIVVNPPGVAGGGIDPEILEHAQENAVTIYSVAVDENGEVIMEFGHGSGFFIEGTEGRLIGTAAHVVEPPDLDRLRLPNGQPLPEGATVQTFVRVDNGELEGTVFPVDTPSGPAVDGLNDIAILDIGQTTPYTGIEIAPPGSVELGETLWTVGTPAHMTLPGTVTPVSVGALEGQRADSFEGTEDVLQVSGLTHGGQSGSLLIDSDGRLVGIMTHGWSGGLPGTELTISYATRSERLAELLEQYRNSPEFLSSEVPGVIDIEGFELWLAAQGEGPDVINVLGHDDAFGVEGGSVGNVIPTEDVPEFLLIGDKDSGFGPWAPDSLSSDDGGVIDSLVEALDALT